MGTPYALLIHRKERSLQKGDIVMRRLINVLFAVLVALTLSACAAATNPVVDHETPIGAYNIEP
jgi:hypothetical protein